MEYVYSTVIIILFSIYCALTARYSFTSIPWLDVLRQPERYGGGGEKSRLFQYLLCWVLMSCTYSLACTYILKTISPKTLYSILGLDSPSVGVAGLSTILFFNVSTYLFFVNKTKHYLRKKRDNFPVTLLDDAPPESEVTSAVSSDIDSGNAMEMLKSTLASSSRQLFYIIPRIFSHIYKYFYLECEHFVLSASLNLADYYGYRDGPKIF